MASALGHETMDDGVKNKLLESAYNGNWEVVVNIYTNTPGAHTLRLNRAGDTALHIAISENQEEIVLRLVELVGKHAPGDSQGSAPALTMGDKQGNTPLHLAAAVGSDSMCRRIAAIDSKLAGIHNKDGLNPILVAVLGGRKEAFSALVDGSEINNGYACARMKNGDTILHSAIRNDYVELAFIIAEKFENLMSIVNDSGMSPLHVLATRPFSFKSGATLPDFFVEDVEPNPMGEAKEMLTNIKVKLKTCFQQLPQKIAKRIVSAGSSNQSQRDAENPAERQRGNYFSDTGESKFKVGHPISDLFKFPFKAIFIILNKVLIHAWVPRTIKEKHRWSIKILKKLLENKGPMKYLDDSYEKAAKEEIKEQNNLSGLGKAETPILIAARNGITEVVYEILKKFPAAIEDTNSEGKNVVLLAVEHQQRNIYELLRNIRTVKRGMVFGKVDNKGNSALHLAAKMGKAWNVPIAQLVWEIKWFEYIKDSMGSDFHFAPYNDEGKTAREILEETHKDLVPKADEWMSKLCSPCSVVAAVIASAALPTSSNVPGGFKDDEDSIAPAPIAMIIDSDNKAGQALLQEKFVFSMYAIASLVALCFSINSLVMFLGIMITQHQYTDFRARRPWKLLLGLASLFISIVATLVSFFSGHYYVLNDVYDQWLLPAFTATLLPTTVFVMRQLPVYLGLLFGTAWKQRRPRYK